MFWRSVLYLGGWVNFIEDVTSLGKSQGVGYSVICYGLRTT